MRQIIQTDNSAERERIFNLEDYDEPVYIGPTVVKKFAILDQQIFNTYDPDGSISGSIQYEIIHGKLSKSVK